ncbi:AbiV family abortive infection protein [Paraburkholderia sediminicola]|uniref:AbiV family abortive infection protein n=1 Tax=Paraburkholderia sediminicola TaxID=458836 RepID=UPI0038B95DFE
MRSTVKHLELTLVQVAFGMQKCRGNASELLTDAALLADKGRHARAYTLAHTACEELAKFFVLQLAGKRIVQANAPDWKRFWRRFRSHDSKITQLSVQLANLQLEDHTVDQDLIAASETLFMASLQPRNASLYVDIGPDGEFRSPSEIDFGIPFPVLSGVATQALRVAGTLGETVTDIVTTLRKPPTVSEQATGLEVLVTILSRIRDAGISKEEVLTELNKHWGVPKKAH